MTEHHLAIHKRAEAEVTREKVRRAMALMAREIRQAADGIYPYNKGKLTQKEVCKRAEISESVPKQPPQHELRQEIRKWLKEIQKKSPTTRAEVKDYKNETIAGLKKGFEILAADLSVYREHARTAARDLAHRTRALEEERAISAALRAKNSELEQRIIELSGHNVLRIDDHR